MPKCHEARDNSVGDPMTSTEHFEPEPKLPASMQDSSAAIQEGSFLLQFQALGPQSRCIARLESPCGA